ncbi:MAG TPA: class I SAM-dependent methyltransferase [Microbacterium sp.]|nr:class I SAM-dependent methyltransferase [Microbacterium sp.]
MTIDGDASPGSDAPAAYGGSGPDVGELHSGTGPDPGEALAERLFTSLVPALELLTIELGRRLGFYARIQEAGDVSAGELAALSGTSPRYAREWLEQQAAAGILAVDGGAGDARRYALPAAHVPVMLDVRNPLHTMGAPTMFTGVATTFDAVVDAFASGTGVAFAKFGPGVRHGLEIFNRPAYANDLADWMTHVPDVSERLAGGGRIVDAGCGTGWSTVALAEAFPLAEVIGIDLDAASIAEAQEHAEEAGVRARVHFVRADAGDADALRAAVGGPAQLVTIFEALHDMLDPERVLGALASLLDEGGVILVGDEQVADEFTAPAEFLDRLNYAFSVLHCLPATIAEGEGDANGTVLRAPTLERWAKGAGLSGFERLAIDHDFWSFYRLSP